MPRLHGWLLLVGAVKPTEEHVRVRRAHLQHYLAARLQPVVEAQRANLVGVVGVLAGAPEGAADFADLAAGVVRGAEAEVVSAADVLRLIIAPVPGGVPLRVLGKILSAAEIGRAS